MLRIIVLLAVAGMMSIAAPAVAQEVLTNQTIVELSKAGIGDNTIVAKIDSSGTSFDVTTARIIELKQAGLSDSVIAAMVSAASKSAVSTSATVNSNSADPAAPHASGIYLLMGEGAEARMQRIDATTSNQTKTSGFLGYALTSGIAKIKIKQVIPGSNARIQTKARRPVFYFYFDQANANLSAGGQSFWTGAAPVTSPNEFSLVRFELKKDRRETAVGQLNITGAKSGVQDAQRLAITYSDIRPGVFKVTPSAELPVGEYGFIYSSSSGGGIGLYSNGATTSRIFDFSILP
jgi:hypothetical protein